MHPIDERWAKQQAEAELNVRIFCHRNLKRSEWPADLLAAVEARELEAQPPPPFELPPGVLVRDLSRDETLRLSPAQWKELQARESVAAAIAQQQQADAVATAQAAREAQSDREAQQREAAVRRQGAR